MCIRDRRSPNGRPSVRAEAPSARRVWRVEGGRCTHTTAAALLHPHSCSVGSVSTPRCAA
eukprot:1638021-Alexandrium_andersonii.AAC.1